MQDRIDALTERLEVCSTAGDEKPTREVQDVVDYSAKTKRGMLVTEVCICDNLVYENVHMCVCWGKVVGDMWKGTCVCDSDIQGNRPVYAVGWCSS